MPVSTIAYGTGNGRVQLQGQTIPVPVDAVALQTTATTTGGTFHAAGTEQALKDAYADIGSSVGYATKLVDVGDWFIGAALVALAVCGGASMIWFQRLP